MDMMHSVNMCACIVCSVGNLWMEMLQLAAAWYCIVFLLPSSPCSDCDHTWRQAVLRIAYLCCIWDFTASHYLEQEEAPWQMSQSIMMW